MNTVKQLNYWSLLFPPFPKRRSPWACVSRQKGANERERIKTPRRESSGGQKRTGTQRRGTGMVVLPHTWGKAESVGATGGSKAGTVTQLCYPTIQLHRVLPVSRGTPVPAFVQIPPFQYFNLGVRCKLFTS